MAVIKHIGVRNANGETYTSHDIGASASNVTLSDGSTSVQSKLDSIEDSMITSVGNGLTKGADGSISIDTSVVAQKTDIPQQVTMENLSVTIGGTTQTYNGSAPISISAAPSTHPDVKATSSALGHVMASTGLNINTSGQLSLASHAETTGAFGKGTSANFGHIKLTDDYNVASQNSATNGAATGTAASAYALQKAYSELNSNINDMKDGGLPMSPEQSTLLQDIHNIVTRNASTLGWASCRVLNFTDMTFNMTSAKEVYVECELSTLPFENIDLIAVADVKPTNMASLNNKWQGKISVSWSSLENVEKGHRYHPYWEVDSVNQKIKIWLSALEDYVTTKWDFKLVVVGH